VAWGGAPRGSGDAGSVTLLGCQTKPGSPDAAFQGCRAPAVERTRLRRSSWQRCRSSVAEARDFGSEAVEEKLVAGFESQLFVGDTGHASACASGGLPRARRADSWRHGTPVEADGVQTRKNALGRTDFAQIVTTYRLFFDNGRELARGGLTDTKERA